MDYLWIKALHVAFMVTWFAGLFYLPRLFVYHVRAEDAVGRERFRKMERRLFAIMTIGAAATAVLGLWMLALNPGLLLSGWFHAKLVLVVALVAYHYWCLRWIGWLAEDRPPHGSLWLRWFNEVPTLLLLAIVALAVVKPF